MIIKDSNLTIMVKDMDKSISFYNSIGLQLKNRWGNYYAQLSGPGITIGLHPAGDIDHASGSGNTSIGFTIDNFDEARTSLEKLSIKSSSRNEEGGQFIHFSDPDGTAIYFIKPKW